MYMKPKYTINKQFFISGFITWFRRAEKEETNEFYFREFHTKKLSLMMKT